MALPGSGKSFGQFRIDDNQCRQFAHEQVNNISPEKFSERVNQQRYDMSYVQCMYKKITLFLFTDSSQMTLP